MDTISIFCAIDDFCELFEPRWQQHLLAGAPKQRDRKPRLCLSEVLTIIVGFHLLGYRTFKGYYTQHVLPHQLHYFPRLVSYQRFVELMPGALLPLCVLLTTRFGQCSGLSFIDSTRSVSATTAVSGHTRSSKPWLNVARPAWIGFMASSSIWWSMTAVSCWPSKSRPAMWMTATRCWS